MVLRRFPIILGLLGLLSACLPGMSPSGTSDTSNSGITTSSGPSTDDASDDASGRSPGGTSGTGTGAMPPPDSYTVAQGGTFDPKADNEAVCDGVNDEEDCPDGLWRMFFGPEDSQVLSTSSPVALTLPATGPLEMSLRLQHAFKTKSAPVWTAVEAGSLIRLIYLPEGGKDSDVLACDRVLQGPVVYSSEYAPMNPKPDDPISLVIRPGTLSFSVAAVAGQRVFDPVSQKIVTPHEGEAGNCDSGLGAFKDASLYTKYLADTGVIPLGALQLKANPVDSSATMAPSFWNQSK